MSATVRLALRLAYSAHAGQRRRRLLVAAAAAVAAFLVLGLAGAAQMLHREQARLARRSVAATTADARAPLMVQLRYDTIDGSQFPVVWMDVRSSDPPLPPGMSVLPAPGEWYVSPELAARMAGDASLRARFPGARTLTRDGILNPREMLAYRRVPAGGNLGELVTPVSRWGTPAAMTIGDPVDLAIRPVVMAAVGFVGVPLVLLLVAALTASAPIRRHRLGILDALGMPARARSTIVAVESAALVLPGVVAAVAAVAIVGPRVTSLPLVGRPVTRGDLAPSLPLASAMALFVLAACVVLGVASDRRGARETRPRPSAAAPRLGRVRLVPIVAGAFLLVTSLFRSGRPAATAALGGVLLIAAGTPVALPLLVRVFGARMASGGGPTRLLAGRRLVADPLSRVRPLLGLATILVVVPVAATWVVNARVTDPPTVTDSGLQSMRVTGAVETFDFGRFRSVVPDAVALRAFYVESSPSAPATLRVVSDCARLQPLFGPDLCAGSSLTPRGAGRLGRVLSFGADVELASALPAATEYSVVVLAPRRPGVESAVRAFMLNGTAPLSVTSEADFVQRESPLVAWILAGMTLLAALTFLTFAVGLVDRTAADTRTRRLLHAVGLTRRRVRAVERREFLLTYTVVVGTGLAAGVVCAWFWHQLDPAGPFPTGVVLMLGTAAAALAGAGAAGLRASERAQGAGLRAE